MQRNKGAPLRNTTSRAFPLLVLRTTIRGRLPIDSCLSRRIIAHAGLVFIHQTVPHPSSRDVLTCIPPYTSLPFLPHLPPAPSRTALIPAAAMCLSLVLRFSCASMYLFQSSRRSMFCIPVSASYDKSYGDPCTHTAGRVWASRRSREQTARSLSIIDD